MKVKEFLEQVQQLLRTTGDEEFEFENPSEMSMFLYGFRAPSRHNGNYVDGVWHMVRPEGKPPIEMKISRGSTVISRRVLIEVANIVTDEVNDMLLCEFGPDAKLHEYICVDGPTPQGRAGGFCCNGKLKREKLDGWWRFWRRHYCWRRC